MSDLSLDYIHVPSAYVCTMASYCNSGGNEHAFLVHHLRSVQGCVTIVHLVRVVGGRVLK